MKETIPAYIGVSPSLSTNAPGHYLPFHGKLYEVFKNQNPQSIYLGAEKLNQSDGWWVSWAPHTLRSRPNFLGLRKFLELCKIARAAKNPYFVIYEGSLFHLCLFSCVSAISGSSALINLHYSSELTSKMKSPLGKFYVKAMFRLSKKLSSGAVVITSESDELSHEIQRRTGVFPVPFPVFSVLSEMAQTEIVKLSHTWVICRLIHNWQLENLIRALRDNPDELFLVNGLNIEQKKAFSGLQNVQIQDQYLTPEEYRVLLAGSKQVVLAYDTEMYKGHSSGRLLDAMIFGKPIVAMEGMPIPLFARDYENLNWAKFSELALKFRNTPAHLEKTLQIKPNASWAVEQIRDLYPKADVEFDYRVKKLRILPFFAFSIFYFVTLITRGCFAVATRFSNLNLGKKTRA